MSTKKHSLQPVKLKIPVMPFQDATVKEKVSTNITPPVQPSQDISSSENNNTAASNISPRQENILKKESDPPTPVDQETSQPSKRQQTNKAIGIQISHNRVRTFLDRNGLNENVDNIISGFKSQILEYETAETALASGKITAQVEKDICGEKQFVNVDVDLTEEDLDKYRTARDKLAPTVQSLRDKVDALSRERARFSRGAPVALSVIFDELIDQLLKHAVTRLLLAKKKMIQISHLHEEGIEKVPLYPLIKTLPSFVKYSEQFYNAKKDAETKLMLSKLKNQVEKDIKKKYGIHTKKEAKETEEKLVANTPSSQDEKAEDHVDSVSDGEDQQTDTDNKTSFKFYVEQFRKEFINKNPNFGSIRMSTSIKNYLSDLLAELIHRLTFLVQLTANCMKNKTISEYAVLCTVKNILTDGHDPVETFDFAEEYAYDPVVLKEERKKHTENKDYFVDLDKIPKVKVTVVNHSISFPTSGFDDLKEKVDRKLELFNQLLT